MLAWSWKWRWWKTKRCKWVIRFRTWKFCFSDLNRDLEYDSTNKFLIVRRVTLCSVQICSWMMWN